MIRENLIIIIMQWIDTKNSLTNNYLSLWFKA